jgi:hypothetical protein
MAEPMFFYTGIYDNVADADYEADQVAAPAAPTRSGSSSRRPSGPMCCATSRPGSYLTTTRTRATGSYT